MNVTKTVAANIKVHEALLSAGEYEKSPHRSKQSKERITAQINFIWNEMQKNGIRKITHADIGCGDGLMFECTPSTWTRYGVDAAPLMLKKCKENHPDVMTYQGIAENLPIPDDSLDIITCYSFLDHLDDRVAFYREAYRTLKQKGLCYFGLSPNRIFADSLAVTTITPEDKFFGDDLLINEFNKAFSNGDYYRDAFGLTSDDLLTAEPGKTLRGGMDPKEEVENLKAVGFKDVKVRYNWIMCQNKLDQKDVNLLEKLLPVTASCFKYFDIHCCK